MASTSCPFFCDAVWKMVLSRSVSNAPGSKLFTVTPCAAIGLRAKPAAKPVKPLRAPLDKPKVSIGALTALEVMLMMRPKPRAAIPSTVAWIKAIGVSMLASTARIQASRSQSRKFPVGGPPALVTTISKSACCANTAARPASVVMSWAQVTTCTADLGPSCERNSAAANSKTSDRRATITTLTPSCAKA